MANFNRPELPQAFADLLGIKGGWTMDVTQQLFPGVNVLDLVNSPYLRYFKPVNRQATQAAVAASKSFVGVRVGQNVALQVLQIVMVNETANPIDMVAVIMTAANITTMGVNSAAQLQYVQPREIPELTGSDIITGDNAAVLGTGMVQFRVPANDTVIWEIPQPGIIIRGDDPGGRGCVGVWDSVVNESIRVGFSAREWPLPG